MQSVSSRSYSKVALAQHTIVAIPACHLKEILLIRTRHYPRLRLMRAAGGHRAPESADGLGDALVHHDR